MVGVIDFGMIGVDGRFDRGTIGVTSSSWSLWFPSEDNVVGVMDFGMIGVDGRFDRGIIGVISSSRSLWSSSEDNVVGVVDFGMIGVDGRFDRGIIGVISSSWSFWSSSEKDGTAVARFCILGGSAFGGTVIVLVVLLSIVLGSLLLYGEAAVLGILGVDGRLERGRTGGESSSVISLSFAGESSCEFIVVTLGVNELFERMIGGASSTLSSSSLSLLLSSSDEIGTEMVRSRFVFGNGSGLVVVVVVLVVVVVVVAIIVAVVVDGDDDVVLRCGMFGVISSSSSSSSSASEFGTCGVDLVPPFLFELDFFAYNLINSTTVVVFSFNK